MFIGSMIFSPSKNNLIIIMSNKGLTVTISTITHFTAQIILIITSI